MFEISMAKTSYSVGLLPILFLLCSCLANSQLQDEQPVQPLLTRQPSDDLQERIALEEFDAPGSVTLFLTGKAGWVPISYRDCDQEQIQCFRNCWNADPPWPRERGKRGHYIYCSEKCLKEYLLCLESQSAKYTFSTVAVARAWLSRNKDLALGAIVVIGLGVFVVATDGAGLVIAPKVMEYVPQASY